jgi:hypothetical protein
MRPLPAILLLSLASACATNPENVCQDVGYCTTQSDAQVQVCKANAQQLATEASASGCSAQYDAYFACADKAYLCTGNVPSFPGCDAERAALDACLEFGRAHNACGALDVALAACPTSSPPPPILPAPCSTAEVCASRCYLDAVTDVCRPQPLQLTQSTACTKSCPP